MHLSIEMNRNRRRSGRGENNETEQTTRDALFDKSTRARGSPTATRNRLLAPWIFDVALRVLASKAKQSSGNASKTGLLRRFAPRNDEGPAPTPSHHTAC